MVLPIFLMVSCATVAKMALRNSCIPEAVARDRPYPTTRRRGAAAAVVGSRMVAVSRAVVAGSWSVSTIFLNRNGTCIVMILPATMSERLATTLRLIL